MSIFQKERILNLALVALPFNIRLLAFLSISDILLILGIVIHLLDGSYRIRRTSRWEVFLVFSLVLLNIVGSLLWYSDSSKVEGFVFIYKFGIILLSLNVYLKELSSHRIYERISLMLTSYLSIYVFYYLFVKSFSGYYNIRVSFPFSETTETDSHLYGYVLGVLLIARLMVKNYEGWLEYILNIISVLALVLTGSRTGFIFVMIALLLVLRKAPKWVILTVPMLIYALIDMRLEGDIETLVNRSLGFVDLLDGDESAGARVFKLTTAIHESAKGYYLLPIGSVNSYALFYDNIMLMILINFGIVGVLYSLLTLIIKVNNYKKIHGLVPFVALLFGINCITEYVLTTRGLLATIVALGLIISNSKKDADTSLDKRLEI